MVIIINYCDCRNTALRNNVKQCDIEHNRTWEYASPDHNYIKWPTNLNVVMIYSSLYILFTPWCTSNKTSDSASVKEDLGWLWVVQNVRTGDETRGDEDTTLRLLLQMGPSPEYSLEVSNSNEVHQYTQYSEKGHLLSFYFRYTVFHVRKHPAAIFSDVATYQNCPLYILQQLCNAWTPLWVSKCWPNDDYDHD